MTTSPPQENEGNDSTMDPTSVAASTSSASFPTLASSPTWVLLAPPPADPDDGVNNTRSDLLHLYFLFIILAIALGLLIYWFYRRHKKSKALQIRRLRHESLARELASWPGQRDWGYRPGGGTLMDSFDHDESGYLPGDAGAGRGIPVQRLVRGQASRGRLGGRWIYGGWRTARRSEISAVEEGVDGLDEPPPPYAADPISTPKTSEA